MICDFLNLTKEEKNFTLGVTWAVKNDDVFLSRVDRLHLVLDLVPEHVRTNVKKMMVVYNLLKKLGDENDNDGFIKFLRLCLIIHRRSLESICLLASSSVNLAESLENAEKSEQENDYLVIADFAKFLHDLRTEAGVSNLI